MPPKKAKKGEEEPPEETEEEKARKAEEARIAEEQRLEEERLEAIRKEEEYQAYKKAEWEKHLWIQEMTKKKMEEHRQEMQMNRETLGTHSQLQKEILENQKRDLQAITVLNQRQNLLDRVKWEKSVQPVWKNSSPLSQAFNKLALLDESDGSEPPVRETQTVEPGVQHPEGWRTPSLVSGLFGEPPDKTLSAHMRKVLRENYAKDAVRFYLEEGREDLTVAKVLKWSQKEHMQYQKDLNTRSAANRIEKDRADFNWDCGHKPFGPPWKSVRQGECFGLNTTLNQSGGGRVMNGQQLLRVTSPSRVYDQSPEARNWIN